MQTHTTFVFGVYWMSERLCCLFSLWIGEQEMQTHTTFVFGVYWMSEGARHVVETHNIRVLTGSFDGTAKLWVATTGAVLFSFHKSDARVFSVAFDFEVFLC